jgi:hypothetical protein
LSSTVRLSILINKGLCLVSVSAKYPIFNLVQSYEEELQRNVMLEAKVANLEKAMTERPLQGKFLAGAHYYANISGLASSITDQPDKPKKKKKIEGIELADLL